MTVAGMVAAAGGLVLLVVAAVQTVRVRGRARFDGQGRKRVGL